MGAGEAVEKHRLHERSALVVWGENWHQGVVGIVASRLVERYYLPTVVVSLTEEQATASARSIDGLSLYETLGDCADLLTKYGGHAMAAGLTLPVDNLPEFQRRFEQLCAEKIRPEDYIPKLAIDGTIKLNQLSFQLIEELSELEPHGVGNPGPCCRQVSVLRCVPWVPRTAICSYLFRTEPEAKRRLLPLFWPGTEKWKSMRNGGLGFVPGVNTGAVRRRFSSRSGRSRDVAEGYVRRWMVDQYPGVWEPHSSKQALDLDDFAWSIKP